MSSSLSSLWSELNWLATRTDTLGRALLWQHLGDRHLRLVDIDLVAIEQQIDDLDVVDSDDRAVVYAEAVATGQSPKGVPEQVGATDSPDSLAA